MKTQIGHLITGDFRNNTLTIEIEKDMEIRVGKYAVVPISEYEKLIDNESKKFPVMTLKERNSILKGGLIKFKKGQYWRYNTSDKTLCFVQLDELSDGYWTINGVINGKEGKGRIAEQNMNDWKEMSESEILILKLAPKIIEVLALCLKR